MLNTSIDSRTRKLIYQIIEWYISKGKKNIDIKWNKIDNGIYIEWELHKKGLNENIYVRELVDHPFCYRVSISSDRGIRSFHIKLASLKAKNYVVNTKFKGKIIPEKRFFICGSSGMIANQLIRKLAIFDDFHVIAQTHMKPNYDKLKRLGLKSPIVRDNISLYELNFLNNVVKFKDIVKNCNVLVYLAGITVNRNYNLQQIKNIFLVNSIVPYLLAIECNRINIPFLYTSSLGVYRFSQNIIKPHKAIKLSQHILKWCKEFKNLIDETYDNSTDSTFNWDSFLIKIKRSDLLSIKPFKKENRNVDIYIISKILCEFLLISISKKNKIYIIRFDDVYGPGSYFDSTTSYGSNKRILRQLLAFSKVNSDDSDYQKLNRYEGVPSQIIKQSLKHQDDIKSRCYIFIEDILNLIHQLLSKILIEEDIPTKYIDFSPDFLRVTEHYILLKIADITNISLTYYFKHVNININIDQIISNLNKAIMAQKRSHDIIKSDKVVSFLLGDNWHKSITDLDKGLVLFLKWLNLPESEKWNITS